MRVTNILDHSHNATDSVALDFDQRNRRRSVMRTEAGREIVLDLERPRHLRGGQAFKLEDGSEISIAAKPEPVVAICCADMQTLVRIAWHLGNRHLPTQIVKGSDGISLRIRQDHVIEAMVEGLNGHCLRMAAPFDPEGGAYSGASNSQSPAEHHHEHV